jgi:hypothetical protein
MDKKRAILELVDNMPQANKAAFYSDPDVEPIVEKLHERWAGSGYRGEPIDYASDEELSLLHRRAKEYASMPSWQAYKLFLERVEGKGS